MQLLEQAHIGRKTNWKYPSLTVVVALNHNFVTDGGGEKDYSFLWTHFHKSAISLVPLGMFYPISLAVSAGKARTFHLIHCFVPCNMHKHKIKPESL